MTTATITAAPSDSPLKRIFSLAWKVYRSGNNHSNTEVLQKMIRRFKRAIDAGQFTSDELAYILARCYVCKCRSNHRRLIGRQNSKRLAELRNGHGDGGANSSTNGHPSSSPSSNGHKNGSSATTANGTNRDTPPPPKVWTKAEKDKVRGEMPSVLRHLASVYSWCLYGKQMGIVEATEEELRTSADERHKQVCGQMRGLIFEELVWDKVKGTGKRVREVVTELELCEMYERAEVESRKR